MSNSPLYTEQSFWSKLKSYAKSAGRDVVELALKLYYCLQDPDTPKWAKTIIIGALAYFIVPVDAIMDFIPGGYVDDWGALAGALAAVVTHIKDSHVQQAKAKTTEWFGAEVI
ncbi:YkvA family protein [uncultured Thiothrix sp.]|uniref:YkvA family protein n=1 Tax=uncultured Thiothrix sp. TaxID=223185 RepID=UPI0026018CC2|nr:YkvA family protein [uncultured Thiothrix sp.]